MPERPAVVFAYNIAILYGTVGSRNRPRVLQVSILREIYSRRSLRGRTRYRAHVVDDLRDEGYWHRTATNMAGCNNTEINAFDNVTHGCEIVDDDRTMRRLRSPPPSPARSMV